METKVLLLVIITLILVYMAHKKTISKGMTAKPGEISVHNNYLNFSVLKHDMTKILFVNLIILAVSQPELMKARWFSANNLSSSIVGKALIASCAFGIYHAFIQPLMNHTPYF